MRYTTGGKRQTTMENNGDRITDLRADLRAVAEFIRPGERVLDLGCGDGSLLRYLQQTQRITGRGVELSEAGVLACVRKGISVRQGDLHEGLTDYPDQSFDTVILSYTIPYLNDPAFIIKEMLRVGRRAIVSFPKLGPLALPVELASDRAHSAGPRPAPTLGFRPTSAPIDRPGLCRLLRREPF